MRLFSFLHHTPMSNYETPLAQAIDLLRGGFTLPFSLRRTLVEQGYNPNELAARYLNSKD